MTPKSWRSLWLVWSLQASSRWIIFLKKSEEGRGAEKRVAISIRLGGVNVLEHQEVEWAANGRAGYCESSWTKKGRAAPRWRQKLRRICRRRRGLTLSYLARLYQSGAEQHWGGRGSRGLRMMWEELRPEEEKGGGDGGEEAALQMRLPEAMRLPREHFSHKPSLHTVQCTGISSQNQVRLAFVSMCLADEVVSRGSIKEKLR